MGKTTALIIAIVIIVAFVILFFVTFLINRKTPVPKGCENIKISEEACGACQVTECSIKQKFEYNKLKEEVEKLESEEDVK